ncbi:hypothetical protein AWZ03_007897 [Drosophila navojoa]|uniref:Uncharacterized protein n=1 Tax=Drosophila navojoa TaxID=7232 RepID=A0A484BBE4_DRONA|nr:probable isoaspartyl peptidase/L-asparaginase GA20639 [Drosophila navojoa]TDG45622.1 hypothetical protein AWZ03_007897 [Drosophila navojoa]
MLHGLRLPQRLLLPLLKCQTITWGKRSLASDAILPTVLVHGGAGHIDADKVECVKLGVKQAAQRGYKAMLETGSALNAVEQAVMVLEADIHFNAGYGSVLTENGNVEMDASIMDGSRLEGGCVTMARSIMHPISLARCVMEKTNYRFLAGDGAMRLAKEEGFEILPKNALVTEASQKLLKVFKISNTDTHFNVVPGTVGAVAIDAGGNVAAATSTGGLTGKLSGRVGDSPILGAGTYADNEAGAVSATGHGESIMRYNLSSRVLALVRHKNYSIQQAVEEVLQNMTAHFKQTGGLIAIDHRGQLGIYFTTELMSWAYQQGKELHCGVEFGEDEVEIVDDDT